MRLDYRKERFSKVSVCGVECEFNDMRSLEMMTVVVTLPGSNWEYWSISSVHIICDDGQIYMLWKKMGICGWLLYVGFARI